MLIKCYGEFWNPFTIEWDKRELFGTGPKEFRYKINFWEAKGIYILIKDFKAVYVGKAFADTSGIGKRVDEHRTDRFAGRWDMFSWYSVSKPNKTKKNVNKPANRQIKLETAVATLEALSILITDPPLNRKRETIPDALEFEQVKGAIPKSNREYFEDILSKI